MNVAELGALAAVLVLAGFNCWAIWRLFHSPFYSRGQRLAQVGFVLLVPFLGAFLVLYLARANQPASSGTHPIENRDAEDVAFSSNYDVGPHE